MGKFSAQNFFLSSTGDADAVRKWGACNFSNAVHCFHNKSVNCVALKIE